ncbi:MULTISPECIES: hypothetical protein [unclassified Lentimonas]|uniref:hypothetical protein n=1 Tax=unclassified Lentimonas TaxID=2630993 RepID=UPI001389FFF3|nr:MULTISPECIES: hypothetical protein [unclassified Lentimonas]
MQNEGVALAYAPLIITAIPTMLVLKGWQVIDDMGSEKIYPPAGLTEEQVLEQVDLLPGGEAKTQVHIFGESYNKRRWIMKKGDAIVFVEFEDGITVGYEGRPNEPADDSIDFWTPKQETAE